MNLSDCINTQANFNSPSSKIITEILWSLGAMQIQSEDLSLLQRDRLLVITNRILSKLPIASFAYAMYGLSRVGFTWADMATSRYSISGGTSVVRFTDSAVAYMTKNLFAMKVREFVVTLSSVGSLLGKERKADLPKELTDKFQLHFLKLVPHADSKSAVLVLQGD